MTEPRKFSKRKDELYPIEWFKEPYSLLAVMLCRIYGLPNYSFFKEEWAPIAHHIITTVNLFLGPQSCHWNLKIPYKSSRRPLLRKSPIFTLLSSLWTYSVLIFVTLIWDGVGNYRPHLYISIIPIFGIATMWLGSMIYLKVSLAGCIF